MLLITDLADIPPFEQPCGLTIGTFDGVHLGHQVLLNHLRAKLPAQGLLVVVTFSNHPSQLFTPQSPIPLVCSALQKVKHLADYGADIVCLIPFTPEFAATSFKDFFKTLKARLGFSQLALGEGAVIGNNREGTESQIKHLATQIHFEVDYLPKYLVNGTPVSSRRVRKLIQTAQFDEIAQCLGRPYSLMGGLRSEKNHYLLHFPGICLPPTGTYPIRVHTFSNTYQDLAHVHQNHTIRVTLEEGLDGKEAQLIF